MRRLFALSLLLGIACTFGAEEIQVLGAAKTGDGSEIAKAFESFRTAKLKSSEGGWREIHTVRLQAMHVIQLPAGTLNGIGDQGGSMDQSMEQRYFGYVNSEGFDWITVRVESSKDTAEGLKEELDMIQETVAATEKLTPAQQTQIVQILAAPRRKDAYDAWRKAQSNLKDKKLVESAATAIIAVLKDHEADEATRNKSICDRLTPKQAKVFRTQFQISDTAARATSNIFAPRANTQAGNKMEDRNTSVLEQIQNRGKKDLSNLEIVGVAKVGDGSPIARAWLQMPAEIKAAEEKARKDWDAFAGKGNRISGAAFASVGGPACEQKPDPVHWVVQLKMKAPINGGSVHNHRMSNDKELYSFMHQLGGGATFAWIGVGKIQDSSIPRGDPLQWLRDNAAKIDKSAHPLDEKQKSEFEKILSSHGPDAVPTAWSNVEANLSDKDALKTFVETYFLHKDDSSLASMKFDALLTSAQKKVLQGNGPRSSMSSSSGPDGGISVATVTANGKTTLTITLQNMLLSAAAKNVIEKVNEEFEATLQIPKVDGALAQTRLNCKIVLDSADGVILKLANAAGCKADSSSGNMVLKAK